jgi:ABC-type bacteriocin/lantibiotic exporter with double-glycine peptidase domain
MYKKHIKLISEEIVSLIGHDYNDSEVRIEISDDREYKKEEASEFIRDLIDVSRKINLVFLESRVKTSEFKSLIKKLNFPIVVFTENEEGELGPLIINPNKKELQIIKFEDDEIIRSFNHAPMTGTLLSDTEGKIIFLSAFSFYSLVSDEKDEIDGIKPEPITRFFRLLKTEKKDITYIYVYAVIVGIISLSLPLGIQAIIGLISGGMMFSSVVLLITFVIMGIVISGGLQIMQISLVEVLQRRVFTNAALEFAFRIPRIRMESILKYHAPELMNRFFDILTIQKGLPKLLIDLSAAALQIVFGLILLAFYHPFFIFFGGFLLAVLIMIFYITGPKGLKSSITESKYKYKVAFWLEELARTIVSFKVAGTTNMPIQKTDYNLNNYLTYRKKHFKVLISQFGYILAFKTLVTGGLLILGTVLVIDRQITLGQFVASEIVVILIINAVEKIILGMDVIYDLLTSVDKLGQVTDLPLEKSGRVTVPHRFFDSGIHLKTKNLRYKYPETGDYILKGIDLDIKPGEKICIAGFSNSGKSTLINVLSGIYCSYEGAVTFNNLNLRDLHLNSLRDHISKNVSQEDIFDGTILENLSIGKSINDYQNIIQALEDVGLGDVINSLPKGLETELVSGGRPFPSTTVNKLILARCIAKNPKLFIVNDFFQLFQRTERERMLELLVDRTRPWTLLTISNDPMVMEACDRVLVLQDGKIISEGKYQELKNLEFMSEIVYN